MKKLLTLDISSSTIGYSYFEYDEHSANLIDYGHIKPPSKAKAKGVLPYRLDKALEAYNSILMKYKPDDVAIEDYAKRFSKGKSTAQTIIILSVFNEMISWATYKFLGKEAIRYPVLTIRSVLSKHFNEKIISKEQVYPAIKEHCKLFTPLKNKNGNEAKESYDQADAIALGITTIIKQVGTIKKWNI